MFFSATDRSISRPHMLAGTYSISVMSLAKTTCHLGVKSVWHADFKMKYTICARSIALFVQLCAPSLFLCNCVSIQAYLTVKCCQKSYVLFCFAFGILVARPVLLAAWFIYYCFGKS